MGSKAGLLANLWFKPNEISLATSIASTGQILGMGLGFFLPPFVIKVNPVESSDPQFNQSRGDSSIIVGIFPYCKFTDETLTNRLLARARILDHKGTIKRRRFV